MQHIELSAVPNQSLSVRLEQDFYEIRVMEAHGVMAIDVIRNNAPITLGQRLTPGFLAIPYQYLYVDKGNFLLITDNDAYPYYTEFGVTQFLIYVTAAEMEAFF